MNDEDGLERLLREAGEPAGADDATLARLRVHTHAAWQASLRRRRAQRTTWALAASVVLALAVALPFAWRAPARPLPVAQLLGDPQPTAVHRGSDAARGLPSRTLAVGDELATEDGAVALRTEGDAAVELRVDADTHLRWRDLHTVELLAGRVYVDSHPPGATGPSGRDDTLTIVVGEARVRHLGTQYLVVREGDTARVLVREGRVRIDLDAAAAELVRGQAATFAPGGGAIGSGSADPFGEQWRWVERLAPHLKIEGRDLATVLGELARETGRKLRFASPDVERQARETMLHGPDLDLTAADALAALLSTTGFATVPGDTASELTITLH